MGLFSRKGNEKERDAGPSRQGGESTADRIAAKLGIRKASGHASSTSVNINSLLDDDEYKPTKPKRLPATAGYGPLFNPDNLDDNGDEDENGERHRRAHCYVSKPFLMDKSAPRFEGNLAKAEYLKHKSSVDFNASVQDLHARDVQTKYKTIVRAQADQRLLEENRPLIVGRERPPGKLSTLSLC